MEPKANRKVRVSSLITAKSFHSRSGSGCPLGVREGDPLFWVPQDPRVGAQEPLDGWMDGQVDGWMDRWADGWKDGWMKEQVD